MAHVHVIETGHQIQTTAMVETMHHGVVNQHVLILIVDHATMIAPIVNVHIVLNIQNVTSNKHARLELIGIVRDRMMMEVVVVIGKPYVNQVTSEKYSVNNIKYLIHNKINNKFLQYTAVHVPHTVCTTNER